MTEKFMKCNQWHTKDFRHEYFFTFKGKSYPLNSYVKLTEEGKKFLDTKFDNVQLTEHFYYDRKGFECWKFVTRYIDYPPRPFTVSTNKPLEELAEEVIPPVPPDPNLQQKYSRVSFRDWEVPDVMFGWFCYAAFFIVVEVFKDWFIKLILRIYVGWYFGLWRQKRMIEEAKWKDNDSK